MDFKNDLHKLNSISRDKYTEVFNILRDNIWEYGGGISYKDIKNMLDGKESDSSLLNELGSEEDIKELLNKDNKDYSSKDSEDFISKVKASNVTEISESGEFYKELAFCLDNVKIIDEDCGSEGLEYSVDFVYDDYKGLESDADPETKFEYYFKDVYITELGDTIYTEYETFKRDIQAKNLKKVHVRSPISCKHANTRNFCKKCCGHLHAGGPEELHYKNIGMIATLAITENATQSALSSMNNGISESVNEILKQKFEDGARPFESFLQEIKDKTSIMIGSCGVECRWYELALLCKLYTSDNGQTYKSVSFKSSPRVISDPINSLLSRSSISKLSDLLCGSDGEGNSFKIESLKGKNLFGIQN